MHPRHYIHVPALPLNSNAKVDIHALVSIAHDLIPTTADAMPFASFTQLVTAGVQRVVGDIAGRQSLARRTLCR
jgi:hypothetical protein